DNIIDAEGGFALFGFGGYHIFIGKELLLVLGGLLPLHSEVLVDESLLIVGGVARRPVLLLALEGLARLLESALAAGTSLTALILIYLILPTPHLLPAVFSHIHGYIIWLRNERGLVVGSGVEVLVIRQVQTRLAHMGHGVLLLLYLLVAKDLLDYLV
ncbi:MAG: hypothetical protein ACMG6E_09400, partial [Candidatus Roizmanbacteria bacterium]